MSIIAQGTERKTNLFIFLSDDGLHLRYTPLKKEVVY